MYSGLEASAWMRDDNWSQDIVNVLVARPTAKCGDHVQLAVMWEAPASWLSLPRTERLAWFSWVYTPCFCPSKPYVVHPWQGAGTCFYPTNGRGAMTSDSSSLDTIAIIVSDCVLPEKVIWWSFWRQVLMLLAGFSKSWWKNDDWITIPILGGNSLQTDEVVLGKSLPCPRVMTSL